MIVTIVGAGRLAEGIAVRVLAGEHRWRLADAEPGKADALAAVLAARADRDSGRPSPFVMVAGVPEAIAGSDVVVLAVPYPQGRLIVRDQGAALSGVTVVDTCNPVDFSTFDSLLTSPGMTAAVEVAGVHSAARGVAAFHTTFACAAPPARARNGSPPTFGSHLLPGRAGGLPLDVFLAGDDAEAKSRVAA